MNFKRLFIAALLSALLLSACNNTAFPQESENVVSSAESEASSVEQDVFTFEDISVQWVDSNSQIAYDCDEFIMDTSEYSRKVMFRAKEKVTEFKLVTLDMEEVNSDDAPLINAAVVYNHGDLTTERGLIVSLSLFGDRPGYGVFYTDPDGTERHLVLQESGMDGSIMMWEYE